MSDDILQQLCSLQQQITDLRRQGKDARALPVAVRLNALVREHLGEEHPDYAASLNTLGSVYHAMGDHAAAEPLYRQALAAARRTLGEGHSDVAHNLSSLAALYTAMGNYAAAEPLYRQALEVRRAALGEEHPRFAAALNNLGKLYRAMGNYAAAEPLHRQALGIIRRELGEAHPYLAATLSSLAACCVLLGDYAAAEPLYRQALETRQRILGAAHADVATSAHNLAQLYRLMGSYAAAEPLYQQALAIRRQALGSGHPEVADTLEGIARLYLAIGDAAAAEAPLDQALRIRRAALGSEHPSAVASLCALAELRVRQGDLTAAEVFYRQALAARRHPTGDDVPPYGAAILEQLAWLRCAAGDYAAAEPLLHRALATWRAALGERHPKAAACIHALATYYHARAETSRAELLYRQALAVRQAVLGDEHAGVAETLTGLGALYAGDGRVPEALPHLLQAAAIDDRLLAQLPALRSVADRTDLAGGIEERTAVLLSLLRRYRGEISDAPCLALDLLLRRRPVILDALSSRSAGALVARYPTWASELTEHQSLAMRIARAISSGPGPNGLEAHRQLLSRWRLHKERLEQELADLVPDIEIERRLRGVNRASVARALPPDAALVRFVRTPLFDFGALPEREESWWLPPHYLALVLPAGKPGGARMVDLGDAEVIDAAVAAYLPAAAGTDAESRAAEAARGHALYAAVVAPLLDALGGARRLFVVPDGELARVPLAVLPTAPGRRLIDDYLISDLSSAADLLRPAALPSDDRREALVAADPDFDLAAAESPDALPAGERDSEVLPFEALPAGRSEGEAVAALLQTRPWLGPEVLKQRLKQACATARVLHLSTQGFFIPSAETGDEPLVSLPDWIPTRPRLGDAAPALRSGLALAGANTWLRKGALPPEAEDGILTAEEIAALDLLGVELAVISGCDAAHSGERSGEALQSLRGAFTLAGARTLLLGLWVPPVRPGRDLLLGFYRRVLAGVPCAEALREAQLAVREQEPLPAAWGAFICQGDPGPLRGAGDPR